MAPTFMWLIQIAHSIRQIGIDNRSVTTLAGTVGSSGSTDNPTGTLASFYYWPMGITTDGTNLYVADSDNDLIRQIVISTKAVTTLAGGQDPLEFYRSPHRHISKF